MQPSTFDELGIVRAGGRVAWNELRSVGIRTTPEGPFAEDLFWMFVVDDGLFELPGSALSSQHLQTMQEHLPGFDHGRVLDAAGSTEDGVFRVWHSDAPKLVWTTRARRARFEDLVSRLDGDRSLAAATFEKLEAASSEPTRGAHDRRRLAERLLLLDGLRGEAADPDVVELALWFHIASDDPRARAEGPRSAERLAEEAARVGIAARRATSAAALLRWTAPAAAKPKSPTGDAALLLDIDLAIFASDPVRLLEYEHALEAGRPFWFRFKRGRFLASLVARDRLFRTDGAHARFEARARAQISGLLASPRHRALRATRLFRWPWSPPNAAR